MIKPVKSLVLEYDERSMFYLSPHTKEHEYDDIETAIRWEWKRKPGTLRWCPIPNMLSIVLTADIDAANARLAAALAVASQMRETEDKLVAANARKVAALAVASQMRELMHETEDKLIDANTRIAELEEQRRRMVDDYMPRCIERDQRNAQRIADLEEQVKALEKLNSK